MERPGEGVRKAAGEFKNRQKQRRDERGGGKAVVSLYLLRESLQLAAANGSVPKRVLFPLPFKDFRFLKSKNFAHQTRKNEF